MTTHMRGRRRGSSLALALAASGMLAGCAAPLDPRVATIAPIEVSQPSGTPTPLMPAVATPSPIPRVVRLTEAGCCAHAWWSESGDRILFIDDPPGGSPLGVYSVSPAGGDVRREGPDTGDPQAVLALRPEAQVVSPVVPDEARAVRISPDGTRVAWSLGTTSVANVDQRQRTVWSADLATESAGPVVSLIGGDLLGWSSDGLHILATGAVAGGGERGLWAIPLDGRQPRLLLKAERIRSPLLSPTSRWVALFRAFESDPSQNGMWLVETDGNHILQVPGLASYRWRDDRRLLYLPYDLDADLALMELDLETGRARVAADGEAFAGGIATNDWSVSPSGEWLVYRSAEDGSLRALELGAR